MWPRSSLLCLVLVTGISSRQLHDKVIKKRSTGHSDHGNETVGWGYDEAHHHGPSSWTGDCVLQKQSPINIVTDQVKYDAALKPPKLTGYGTAINNAAMTNNGHSVSVTLPDGMTMELPGQGLTFKAVSFHFHWGRNNNVGSEHAVNSKTFPMEMHVVHINTKYPDQGEAIKHSDGLAVFGFLFKEGVNNSKFNPITNNLRKVAFKGNTTSVSGFSMADLMLPPASQNKFYRYEGSLTTPPCSEAIYWTVFSDTISVSKEQLDEFHTHVDLDDHVHDNHRPPMPLHHRVVSTADQSLITASQAGRHVIGGSTVSMAAVVLLLANTL